MKYGINVNYLARACSFDTALSAVKNAGFTVLDHTPDYYPSDWKDKMAKQLESIKSFGLTVEQTHAPFNRYDERADFVEILNRAVEATAFLGAKYMVVHGDEFDFSAQSFSDENALEYNYRLYAPIVEKASALGVKVAFENVFEDNYKGRPRFCSHSEQLISIIEKFGTDNACCCLDTGHGGVSFGSKLPEKIAELGKYIECTHVHDCGHSQDLHLPPFLGDIDWDACMKAFANAGYNGCLTYEMVYGKIPETMVAPFAGYLKGVADTLVDKFNA